MGKLMNHLKSSASLASCGLILGLGLYAHPAVAQSETNPTDVGDTADSTLPSDESSAAGLTDIVVTAQKRTECFQEVPISATVLSGAALAKSF